MEFEALFAPFAQAAAGRLGYLHPALHFQIRGSAIVVEGDAIDATRIRRDVLYQLYREKIYQEGASARALMHRTLLS